MFPVLVLASSPSSLKEWKSTKKDNILLRHILQQKDKHRITWYFHEYVPKPYMLIFCLKNEAITWGWNRSFTWHQNLESHQQVSTLSVYAPNTATTTLFTWISPYFYDNEHKVLGVRLFLFISTGHGIYHNRKIYILLFSLQIIGFSLLFCMICCHKSLWQQI